MPAAEGAILVLKRIWPAFQTVDTSSGSLGHAVNKTVHELLDLLLTVAGSGGVSSGANELEGRYALAWARNIWADTLA